MMAALHTRWPHWTPKWALKCPLKTVALLGGKILRRKTINSLCVLGWLLIWSCLQGPGGRFRRCLFGLFWAQKGLGMLTPNLAPAGEQDFAAQNRQHDPCITQHTGSTWTNIDQPSLDVVPHDAKIPKWHQHGYKRALHGSLWSAQQNLQGSVKQTLQTGWPCLYAVCKKHSLPFSPKETLFPSKSCGVGGGRHEASWIQRLQTQ